jgi:hypothetical protein
MATENRGVMVYLPPEIEVYLARFCTENGIVRRNKTGDVLPSLGTGIVTHLERTMSGDSFDKVPAAPPSIGGLDREQVIQLINERLGETEDWREEIVALTQSIEGLESHTNTQIEALREEIAAFTQSIEELESPNIQLEASRGDGEDEPVIESMPVNLDFANDPELTQDDRRWLKFIGEKSEIRTTIGRAIEEGWEDRLLADRLLEMGFGGRGNTIAYSTVWLESMKQACLYISSRIL